MSSSTRLSHFPVASTIFQVLVICSTESGMYSFWMPAIIIRMSAKLVLCFCLCSLRRILCKYYTSPFCTASFVPNPLSTSDCCILYFHQLVRRQFTLHYLFLSSLLPGITSWSIHYFNGRHHTVFYFGNVMMPFGLLMLCPWYMWTKKLFFFVLMLFFIFHNVIKSTWHWFYNSPASWRPIFSSKSHVSKSCFLTHVFLCGPTRLYWRQVRNTRRSCDYWDLVFVAPNNCLCLQSLR